MSFMLTRMFAYLTLVAYLAVGSFCVRVFAPEMTTLEISLSYSKLLSKTLLNDAQDLQIVVPEVAFNKIIIEENIAPAIANIARRAKAPKAVVAPKLEAPKLAKHELNFNEPVILKAISMADMLPITFAVNFVPFQYHENHVDEVSTKLASNAEPEFFSYETEPTKTEINKTEEITEVTQSPKAEEIAVEEMIAFDYSVPEVKTTSVKVVEPSVKPGQVFNTVTTQASIPTVAEVRPSIQDDFKNFKGKEVVKMDEEKEEDIKPSFLPSYPNEMTIQVSGTNLKQTKKEFGFEVRFQDDLNQTIQDFGDGSVVMNTQLAEEKMTRSLSVVKQGFAPTNTDIIYEAGRSEITLPLLEESVLRELIEPYEKYGPIGAVLVELGDEIETLDLDVPYGKVLTLDENLKVTTSNNYLYHLFVGVKAGNAFLTYKDNTGESISKILHVHEQELTYESYFSERVEKEKIELFEEGLLGREKIALGISSSNVVEFATTKTAQKLTANKFNTNFKKTLLGGRRYLELSHQEEPIFVGYKNNTKLDIPSENFMRLILSKFEGSGLGNRCVIQVNLSRKVLKIDVGSESVEASVMTYVQMLDSDGRFYDSAGEKTTKVVVVGESQAAQEVSKDSKINFKLTYEDGSEQFLSSYCSPNSYLVEQL